MGLSHKDRAAICGRGAARRRAPAVSVGSAFSLTSVFHQQVSECIKRRESGRFLRCGKLGVDRAGVNWFFFMLIARGREECP